jgi:hypothetical protein
MLPWYGGGWPVRTLWPQQACCVSSQSKHMFVRVPVQLPSRPAESGKAYVTSGSRLERRHALTTSNSAECRRCRLHRPWHVSAGLMATLTGEWEAERVMKDH